jgi:NitT/TauT family transport system substrate-binding protein
MRGLKAANMSASDVQLVPMEPFQMPDALENATVDAYSAWEPTPSISLARDAKNRAIYRGMSTDWVVMPRQWASSQPKAATALMASYVRSINWMRKTKSNLEQAAHWVIADGNAFSVEAAKPTIEKAMEIARKDLLDVPGAPSIPALLDGVAPLVREFIFLKELGVISGNVSEDVLRTAFGYGGLKVVQSDPKGFRLFAFDYDK